MDKIAVNILETHASHQCNLSCTSCSHFSNHRVPQSVDLQSVLENLEKWTQYLSIREFRILGGEPLLNKSLEGFLSRLRELPLQRIKLITNGLLFSYKDDGFGEMLAKNSIDVIVSIHSEEEDYLAMLAEARTKLEDWKQKFALEFELRPAFRNWTRRYHGYGDTLRPYQDGNPKESYSVCPAKYCKQLYEGKIYKCAPVTYLNLLQAKYSLSIEWNEFLHYIPLDITASRSKMLEFFELGAENICGLCPSNPKQFIKDPFGRH